MIGNARPGVGRNALDLDLLVGRHRVRDALEALAGVFDLRRAAARAVGPDVPELGRPVRHRDRPDDLPLLDASRELHRAAVDHVRPHIVVAEHDGLSRAVDTFRAVPDDLARAPRLRDGPIHAAKLRASEPKREATIGSGLSMPGTRSRPRRASQGMGVGVKGSDGCSGASDGTSTDPKA